MDPNEITFYITGRDANWAGQMQGMLPRTHPHQEFSSPFPSHDPL